MVQARQEAQEREKQAELLYRAEKAEYLKQRVYEAERRAQEAERLAFEG